MPNIASILKEEIARVARKEVRSETASLKKAATTHRTEIAALKRRSQELEKEIRSLTKALRKAGPASPSADAGETPKSLRFSAKGLASQRIRLGLSAEDCGRLVGASGQSIYNWESGKARPRVAHLASIAALKAMGKKEANARLAALRESEPA